MIEEDSKEKPRTGAYQNANCSKCDGIMENKRTVRKFVDPNISAYDDG